MAKKKRPGTSTRRTIKERKPFKPDPKKYTTSREKNGFLGKLLQAEWKNRPIVEIRRVEIGTPGWEATYRIT